MPGSTSGLPAIPSPLASSHTPPLILPGEGEPTAVVAVGAMVVVNTVVPTGAPVVETGATAVVGGSTHITGLYGSEEMDGMGTKPIAHSQ
jgi:hypothetical protein